MRILHGTEIVTPIEIMSYRAGPLFTRRIDNLVGPACHGAVVDGPGFNHFGKMADLRQRDRSPSAQVEMQDQVEVVPAPV